MTLSRRFQKSLQYENLLLPGEKIFVACSGGPDSVALFHLLRELAPAWKWSLGLLHFNHRLRGRASDRDERFVKRLAEAYGLPVISERARRSKMRRSARMSPEEYARHERYGFFCRQARRHRIKKVALAHTRDDQAETVLMRLLQGTGPRGLGGIRPDLQYEGVRFVRPLLEFSKKELRAYLRQKKMPFCVDATNTSERFVRNKIRLRLLPWIEREINPKVSAALARFPAILEEENRMVEELEATAWKKSYSGMSKRKLRLDRRVFLKLPPTLQFRILGRALRRLDPTSGLSFDAWGRLRRNLLKGHCRQSLPGSIDLCLSSSGLALIRTSVSSQSGLARRGGIA
jgi:tRNA(Ile)-lysidine synthase